MRNRPGGEGEKGLEVGGPARAGILLEVLSLLDHEKDRTCRQRGDGGLDAHGQAAGLIKAVEQGQGTLVGGRVAETREGALNQGRGQALVEAGDATVLVQGLEGLHGRRAVPVLVVDSRTKPHESQDLDAHGSGTRDASAERLDLEMANESTLDSSFPLIFSYVFRATTVGPPRSRSGALTAAFFRVSPRGALAFFSTGLETLVSGLLSVAVDISVASI